MAYIVQLQSLFNTDTLIKSSFNALQLYCYGYEDCSSDQHWGPGIKDHVKIHIIFNGQGHYLLNGQRFDLRKGHAFLTTPNTVVEYYADALNPWSYGWIAFDGPYVADYFKRTAFTTSNPLISLDDDSLSFAYNALQEMLLQKKQIHTKDLFEVSFLYKILEIGRASCRERV